MTAPSMATKAASSSLSPCIRLIEESLLLPTQDVGLFASTFLLIFAHTFAFIAVAVHFAHPLATSLLADIEALVKSSTTSSHESYSTMVDTTTREHAKKLLLIYLAYVASKLATQLAAALAASATYSGERLTRKAVRDRVPGLLCTAAVAGALELSLTALLVVAPLVSTWTLAGGSGSSGAKSACGYSLLLVALLLDAYLGTVVTVGVAASAADRGCHGIRALCRAWRLVRAAGGKEAAVLVFVVSLLPAVVYPAPVYAFSFAYPAERYSPWYQGDSHFSGYYSRVGNQDVWLLGVVSGSGLPSVGAQLFAMVAATVFCCMSMETNAKGARPV
ncbi:hypothetical protein BS78_02G070500 [Paspalum vaginatum]|nr:hypothetical protein BS78_02G070500 [Paspalum vaginatum]